MKKGFTIVEVSILFVIFLIVGFLVVPLSLDDTVQAKCISRWKNVQQDFNNMFYFFEAEEDDADISLDTKISSAIDNEIKNEIKAYKIKLLNGRKPENLYTFDKYKITYSNNVIAYKFFDTSNSERIGIIMYDVNGKNPPNTWGKDVFALNIYKNGVQPLGKEMPIEAQKKDCSRNGTGLFCSNYYLIGGNFD